MVSTEWEVNSRHLKVESKTFNRGVLRFSSSCVEVLGMDFNAEGTESTKRNKEAMTPERSLPTRSDPSALAMFLGVGILSRRIGTIDLRVAS